MSSRKVMSVQEISSMVEESQGEVAGQDAGITEIQLKSRDHW